MNKQIQKSKRLALAKESLRKLVAEDIKQVGGGFSCGALSACDCSGGGTTNGQSIYCTRPQW